MNTDNMNGDLIMFALSLWDQQIEAGIGLEGEAAAVDNLGDWLDNRTYTRETLERAAAGDVEALALVRSEAGLPVLS